MILQQMLKGVKQVNIMLLSQIGKPIDESKAATSQLIFEDGYKIDDLSKKVESIVDDWLEILFHLSLKTLLKGTLEHFKILID